MNMNKIREHIKQNKVLVCCYLCIICVVSISAIIMYNFKIQEAMLYPKNVLRVKERGYTPEHYVTLAENTRIEQKITMVNNSFTGISLWFEENKVDEESEILVRLLDESREIVEKWQFSTFDIEGGTFFNMFLEKMDVNIGDNFFIVVTAKSDGKVAVPMGISERKSYKNDDMFSDIKVRGRSRVEVVDGDYLLDYQILDGGCGTLKYFYLAVMALIFSIIAIVYVLLITHHPKEWIFAVMAFFIGCLYLLIIPPYAVPDEDTHFITAYAKSSAILGKSVENENGDVIFEPDGATYFVKKYYPDRSSYIAYIRGIFGKEVDASEHEMVSRKSLNKRNLGYAPQVLGLTLGRLLNVNGIWLFIFGRMTALLWYCFIMFWSIRFIPEFGKNIIFISGILPMTMQQAVSYNYDSVLFGASFFAVSYILYLAFDVKKEKVILIDYLLLVAVATVIVPIKFIYMLIFGMGLLIPSEKFGGKKNKIISATAIVIFCLLILRMARWGVVANAVSTGTETAVDKYSLMDCLQNPIQTIVMFYRTVEGNSTYYLQTMIGTPLGWLEINVPNIIIYGFAFLLICSIFEKQEEKHWGRGERIWILLLAGAVAVLVLLALLIDWTTKGEELIGGVQGRYFLPILPLLLLALQNHSIIVKKKIDTFLITSIMFLHISTALNVVSVVSSR